MRMCELNYVANLGILDWILQYRRELNDLVNFFMCFKNIYKLNIFDYVSFRS